MTFLRAVTFSSGVALAAAGLVGCGGADMAAHAAGQQDVTGGATYYKVGKPYRIKGKWYHPREDWDYEEVGYASWYGPQFHGRKTANGEIYDMNGLTAAHRTLPLPSWVEVTNLANNRKIVVRVNDRGPYAHGRILDLSRAAARKLGFENQGVTKVRIRLLQEPSLAAKEILTGKKTQVASRGNANAATARLNQRSRQDSSQRVAMLRPQTVIPAIPVVTPRQGRAGYFVQAGAFTDYQNARSLQQELGPFGMPTIETAPVGSRTFYRVRFGPIKDVKEAETLRNTLLQNGFDRSHVVSQ